MFLQGGTAGSQQALQVFRDAVNAKSAVQKLQAPTVKVHLAAIRRLFDFLVTGQIVMTNPVIHASSTDESTLASRQLALDQS